MESSAVDLKKYFFKNIFSNKIALFLFYNFFIFYANIHIILFTPLKNSFISTSSIDKYFFNANWLEREVSEMYGIFFFLKKDNRKLLLDYSKNENPLLKDYPCEGVTDVFYNFFDLQINYIQNEVIEL